MKYKISHRGNLYDRLEFWENKPTYIDSAISEKYDVEVDVWLKNHMLYLGHDKPLYQIGFDWLAMRSMRLWIHCKNIESFKFFGKTNLNYFYHTTEKVVLTSRGIPWYFTGEDSSGGICVMPELHNNFIPKKSIGICSDKIKIFVD